ncbi:MAG: restriction endonuclease [Acidobacteriota bacterium]|nr:restriction endonuclease [Acidobacteriota bacterium]
MQASLGTAYKSGSQRARKISEGWGCRNLYCPRCDSPRIEPSAANTSLIDFVCPKCAASFQLKSQSHPFSRRITDSAYEPMRRAIHENRLPHFFILQYDPSSWHVCNLTLVPSFALTISCLEKRKPLAITARRSGWVGCNILLFRIPKDARIQVVSDGRPCAKVHVRRQFRVLQPLERFDYETRGWTLDVLNIVRSLEKPRFSLGDIYAHIGELQLLHPRNLHPREKVRQQLQRLRDMEFVEFLGGGKYLLRP